MNQKFRNPQPPPRQANTGAMLDKMLAAIVDHKNRIAFQPIPFCGDDIVKRAFQDCCSAGDEQSTPGQYLRLLILRDPCDRLYAAFASTYRSHVKAGSAPDATIDGMRFVDFALAVIESGVNPIDQSTFESQSKYVSTAIAANTSANYSDWLVPWSRVPQLMTALERQTHCQITHRKASRPDRQRDFFPGESFADVAAARLFEKPKSPHHLNVVDESTRQQITDHFSADQRLYQRSHKPPATASLRHHWPILFEAYESVRQISSKTSEDRYPKIFRFTANELQKDHDVRPTSGCRILSFGCSSGEECRSLRQYFPGAEILGCELRKSVIQAARNTTTDPDTSYFLSNPQALADNGPFDAIFAMSVLCRWPETMYATHCDLWYRFESFVEDVAMLDAQLNIGGLLVLYNSQFRFTDCPVSRNYDALQIPDLSDSGFVSKFDQMHQRLPEQAYPYAVFRKR